MLEHQALTGEWAGQHRRIVLARVIKTWGSSPRPVGSVMLVNPKGQMAGSVSGGCVEGVVVKKSLELFADGKSMKLDFGIADEDAWSVGLSCGGSIEVLLECVDFDQGIWKLLLTHLQQNMPSVLVTSLVENQSKSSLLDENGTLHGEPIPKEVILSAQQAYDQRSHRHFSYGGLDYFIHVFPRKSTLLIIGAAHITVDLVSLGNQFGFETVVIDPRGYFTENISFPDSPARIIAAYPSEVLDQFALDAYTMAAILSHDPKIDDDALAILLESKVGYIGALGSRKTHIQRTKRLLDRGISQGLIDRIHAPIGLSINAKTPREIALSIMAQMIEVKNQYVGK